MSDEVLSEREFEGVADEALRALERQLNDLSDEMDAGFEAELASGILTIEFSDGAKYVVNSHRAARQIWMAAERSAWHFDHRKSERSWVTPKGEELSSTLGGLLSKKLGSPVTLTV